MNLLTSIVLLLFGIEDLRSRKISLWFLGLTILVAGIYGVYQYGIGHSTLGSIPGLLLFLLALLQKECIGMGDGLLAIAYGVLYGWRRVCVWLMFSFLLVAVVGVFVKVVTRKRKVQLPFIPFMGLVHMGMCL